MSKNRTILFIHIPKTGGVTLHEVISRQYQKSAILNVKNDRLASKVKEFSEDELSKIKIMKGHMAFGHHKSFPDSHDFSYFTMLRDPVKRIISNYYFIVGNKNHRLHQTITDNNISLKEYVSSGIAENAENGQIRLLSNNIYVPHGECTREMLEQAKHNLDKYFDVVGINERYDETILFLQDEYNWKFPYYTRANVTSYAEKPKEIDQDTLATIIKYNALDIELYNYVKENFENRIQEAGMKFQKRLKRFKKMNSRFGLLVRIKSKIWGFFGKKIT